MHTMNRLINRPNTLQQILNNPRQRMHSRCVSHPLEYFVMEPKSATTLARRRPELLAEWKLQLRSAPVVSALALPASLEYLMTRTLDDLAIHLGLKTPATPVDWPPRCGCGRNPFRAYYLTGESALINVLAAHSPASLERARAAWQQIASAELGAFCGLCQFCGTAKLTGGCQSESAQPSKAARPRSKPASPKRRRQTALK